MSRSVTVVHGALRELHLPLVAPLVTSRGPIVSRDVVVVALGDERGQVAHGEAAPLPGLSHETIEEVQGSLQWAVSTILPGAVLRRAEDVTALLDVLPLAPSARHALDQALLGLLARRRGVSLAQLLHPGPRGRVPVHTLVTGPEDARKAVAEGARCLKVKVGARTLEEDREKVAAIRAVAPASILLRLDPNGAWTPSQALQALHKLAGFGLQCVEQPVARGDAAVLAAVRRASPVPIAADESVHDLDDLDAVIGEGAADAVVIKPMLAGGPTRAIALAKRAAAAGLPVSVTSLLDSAIARSAALAVAAACPGTLWTCGLHTGHFLARDVRPTDEAPWVQLVDGEPTRGTPIITLEPIGRTGTLARLPGRAA